MQGSELFISELKQIGHDATLSNGWVEFDYEITGGTYNGQKVKMAIKIPPNFPIVPPGGFDFSPRLRPLNPSAGHPLRSHESSRFKTQGEYWSRPFQEWNKQTQKDTKTYMSWVRNLWITT